MLVLGGDGVGPEVIAQARRVVDWFVDRRGLALQATEAPYGASAWRELGHVLPPPTLQAVREADAILFGAIGGPEYDRIPAKARFEGSVLRMRRELALYANLRPVRHWQERGPRDGISGRLVHVASRAAYRGDSPAHWHYAAAKGGMIAMHKTIARAYAGQGILSFAVTPGFTDTDMAGDYLASRGGPGLLADIPLGRVATPDEIAGIIAFCALDAPASMTGAVIDANGASYVR
jgi:isocitrate/isopropylmalate dehydrogenase